MVCALLVNLRRERTTAYRRQEVYSVRTHLANVLLALEMLYRKARPNSYEARVASVGISSARKLARLLL